MVVGVSRITLSLPGNASLKGKRKVVRRIVERTRNTFHVAAAEVGALDRHTAIELGFAVVSNDPQHANSVLDKVRDFVATLTEAVVVGTDLEILHVGSEHA